jgi:putative tryptophan/tyrosine transport system substrate-binding protein
MPGSPAVCPSDVNDPSRSFGDQSCCDAQRRNRVVIVPLPALRWPVRRREFITLLGGAALASPLAASAQQGDRVRRIGVLMQTVTDDPEARANLAAFVQGLEESGWTLGRNVRIDYRWGGVDAERLRSYATELVALTPDIVLAVGGTSAAALQQATRTVPIVFVDVTNPVGRGLVDSLARPGGNVTGFTPFESGISAKWLELLKQVAPGLKRVAVIWDPSAPGPDAADALQSVAPSFGVKLRMIAAYDAGTIERGVTAFVREWKIGRRLPSPSVSSTGTFSHSLIDALWALWRWRSLIGLIVTLSRFATVHRDLIITLASRYQLPAVYPNRFFATGGGLMSYGPDFVDQFRRAAGYVDRILKGEKPADLPVQTPTKFELTVNLKTAKTLWSYPPALFARADEVIE